VLSMKALIRLRAEGVPFSVPLRFEVEGPFRGGETIDDWPELSVTYRARGAGDRIEGRAAMTTMNVWLEYGGETYEVGEPLWNEIQRLDDQFRADQPGTFEELDVEPLDWVTGARIAGKERVGDTPTTKVTGTLDADRMIEDLDKLPGERLTGAEMIQTLSVVDDTSFEAWIAADGIWRRLLVEAKLRVPKPDREALNGLSGGKLSLDFVLSKPNQPVDIEGLGEGRPMDELLREWGVPPQEFLGPGFDEFEPG
jgi:hypothetical protein